MSESQNYNSNSREVLYGSIIGIGRLIKDFLIGASSFPTSLFIIPTFLRSLKDEFREAKDQGKESPISINTFRYYLTEKPLGMIGAFTTGTLILGYGKKIYNFISEHPYALMIPAVTNVLSVGYEKYRSDKLRGLEGKLE